MSWFANRKIGFRILFGFTIAIVIAVIIGVVGIFSLLNVNNSYNVSYGDSVESLGLLEETSNAFQRGRMNTYGIILAESREDKEYYLSRVENFDNVLDKNIREYKEVLSIYNEEDIKDILDHLDHFTNGLGEYVSLRTELIDTMAMDPAYRMEAYNELKNGDLRTKALEVDEYMENIVNYEIEFAHSEIARNMDNAKRIIIIMIAVLAVGAVVAILLALYISKGIARPVKEMVTAADNLAAGDVNVDVKTNTKDEIGELAAAFRNMIANIRNQARIAENIADGDLTVDVEVRSDKDLLNIKFKEMVDKNNEVLNNIVIAADQVAAGSQQVSDSSMALSQGAAEQASSVEELTASLEEVSSQTDVNAKNANDANALAEGAKDGALKGNEKMQEALVAMEEINESSNNISKIIKVIDEIAFQTNILALNAAVEAARAGQHGKGFAVVAEEVRNLAARSADAAKETTEMIEGSIKKAEAGTHIANETAEALNRIVEDIAKAANLIGDIALASNEQASAIGQINQGIMQVSQVVQSNSATSEESAAASEELSGQADLLQEMVGRFKLKNIGKSYRKQEELDLEEIKMIEEAAKEKKNKESNGDNKKAKIVLSDKEFGKY